MQRVVRLSLVGLLTVAGLTACGDKITVPPAVSETPGTVVHSVTVNPNNIPNLAIGDKVTLTASVDADAGITDRTVTWSSSNGAVASVDQNGLVTALAAGNTTIIAKSKANSAVQGSANVSVGAAGANPTVTISTINQTIPGTGSVPANLANVVGQIDVTLNVEANNQKLAGVDLIMNCTGAGNSGKDTVVNTQPLTTADAAPVAEAAAAPVTLSFNTASFNATTGAPAFKNGQCTIKAQARLVGSSTVIASSQQTITLNNPDVVVGTLTAGKTAINPLTGLSWNGTSVAVNAIPVFFTAGRTPVSMSVTFEGKTQRVSATGAQTVTFTDRNDPTAAILADSANIDGITDVNAQNALAITVVDNNGNSFQNGVTPGLVTQASFLANPAFPAALAQFRLDTRKPASGTFNITSNSEQNTGTVGYINGSFRFVADSSAGYRGADVSTVGGNVGATCGGVAYTVTRTSNCDNGGVDSVTVVFETATAATATTWTRVTSPTSLAETATSTANFLRQITTDRLGNADTTYACSLGTAAANLATANGAAGQCTQFSSGAGSATARFGVDKTAPTQQFITGESNRATFNATATPGNYFLDIRDNSATAGASGVGTYAGNGTILVAQTRQTDVTYTAGNITGFENQVQSNIAAAARAGTADVFVLSGSNNSPCMIGRFNAAQANAGPNAMTVLSATGATIGFCTPVPYAPNAGPSGTSGVPAGNVVGYIRTTIVPTDQAGNVGNIFTSDILVDPTPPVVQNVDLPSTVAGNATVSFPIAVSDTGTVSNSINFVGDIIGALARVNYSNTGAAPGSTPNNVTSTGPNGAGTLTLQYPPDAAVGTAFDNVLTRTATANPSIQNFVKTLFFSAGGITQPPATSSPNATSISFYANDAVPQYSAPFNVALSTAAGSTPQITGTNTVFASGTVTRTFTGGFVATSSNATVQNCPAAGCTAGTATTTNTSTTITATATGASGTFNNPFTTVQVWYRLNGTTDAFVLAGTATSAGTSDNGTARTWQYTFTFDPPATSTPSPEAPRGRSLTVAGSAIEYFVIGVNGNGDGIATPTGTTFAIANP